MAHFSWQAAVRVLNYLALIKDKRSRLWAERRRRGKMKPIRKGGTDVSYAAGSAFPLACCFQMPENGVAQGSGRILS